MKLRQILCILLSALLLCAVCAPAVCADEAVPAKEDVIVFSGTDDAICVYWRLDEAVRSVSDDLRAAFVPKSATNTVPPIDSTLIRVLPPQEENGGRVELCITVPAISNGMTMRVEGLLDAQNAPIERTVTFSKDNNLTDRIEIDDPSAYASALFFEYTQQVNAVYCLAGDVFRFGVTTESLQNRMQIVADGVELTANADGSYTAKGGEGTVAVKVAQNICRTFTFRVFATEKERKTALLQTALGDVGSIYGKVFHKVVSLGIVLGPFSVLAVPVLYPLAVLVAPVGCAVELLRLWMA